VLRPACGLFFRSGAVRGYYTSPLHRLWVCALRCGARRCNPLRLASNQNEKARLACTRTGIRSAPDGRRLADGGTRTEVGPPLLVQYVCGSEHDPRDKGEHAGKQHDVGRPTCPDPQNAPSALRPPPAASALIRRRARQVLLEGSCAADMLAHLMVPTNMSRSANQRVAACQVSPLSRREEAALCLCPGLFTRFVRGGVTPRNTLSSERSNG